MNLLQQPRKQTKRLALAAVFFACAAFFSACSEENSPQPGPESIALSIPTNFPAPVAAPGNNPLTREGIALGRMLFYDTKLSGNNTLSCASCHVQSDGFADAGKALSLGSNGQTTFRNSPALFNLAWYPAFFWDGGAPNLESQAIAPIRAHNELNQDLVGLVTELQQDSHYPALFEKAFQRKPIDSQQLLFALAQFQRMLVSADSRYDKYVRSEAGATLTQQELHGLQLVQSKCAGCHNTDLFTDGSYHNNGLDGTYPDDHEGLAWGRGRITLDPQDKGKYRTPSLRNVALTAPFMHDGRFTTLTQVLEHYTSGVADSPTLDPLLKQQANPGIALSADEKTAIIAFLHTLTDQTFTQNLAFSAP